jgi:hypothetical protein
MCFELSLIFSACSGGLPGVDWMAYFADFRGKIREFGNVARVFMATGENQFKIVGFVVDE